MLSAFKNFFITFLVAAIVFGTAAYFATQFLTETISGIFDAESSELDSLLNPTDTPSDTQDTPGETDAAGNPAVETPEKEIEGNSFNMLFVVTDHQPDLFDDYAPDADTLTELQDEAPEKQLGLLAKEYRRTRAVAVVLLRADKERREFTYTVFPSITRITTSSGDHALGDLYDLYGLDYVIDTVKGITGLTVDYHLSVNVTELYEVVNNMGGFPLYLTKDIYYNGVTATWTKPAAEQANSLPLLYRIGKNTIDGSGSIALMMCEDYSSTANFNDRNTLLVNVLTAMLEKLTELPEAEFASFYDKICAEAWVNSTLPTKDLIANIELIYAIKDDTFTKKTVEYPGRFIAETEEESAYFSPNVSSAVTTFKNYRKVIDSET